MPEQPERTPDEVSVVAEYLERAARLQERALACLRRARGDPRAERLPSGPRRLLMEFACQHLDRARELLLSAQPATCDRQLTALLNEHLTKLAAIQERIKNETSGAEW